MDFSAFDFKSERGVSGTGFITAGFKAAIGKSKAVAAKVSVVGQLAFKVTTVFGNAVLSRCDRSIPK